MKKTENKAKSSAPEHFNLMIIGAGPSGLSAAVRAAEHEMSYVLLESELAPASTVRSYLRGKFVMAEPRGLPLRSPLPFTASLREKVLRNMGKRHRSAPSQCALRGQGGRYQAPRACA